MKDSKEWSKYRDIVYKYKDSTTLMTELSITEKIKLFRIAISMPEIKELKRMTRQDVVAIRMLSRTLHLFILLNVIPKDKKSNKLRGLTFKEELFICKIRLRLLTTLDTIKILYPLFDISEKEIVDTRTQLYGLYNDNDAVCIKLLKSELLEENTIDKKWLKYE